MKVVEFDMSTITEWDGEKLNRCEMWLRSRLESIEAKEDGRLCIVLRELLEIVVDEIKGRKSAWGIGSKDNG